MSTTFAIEMFEITEIETTREMPEGTWHMTERRWKNADGTCGVAVMSMLWPKPKWLPSVVPFGGVV